MCFQMSATHLRSLTLSKKNTRNNIWDLPVDAVIDILQIVLLERNGHVTVDDE